MKATATIFLILLTISVKAQLADLVAKNERAIFQIFSYDEYGAPSSTGTGFFVNSQGLALTNLHVLEDAKFAFIRDIKGNIYQVEKITRICKECDMVEFIITSTNNNFAFLNITTVIPAKGSDIFVIGNPEGLESTVSKGIVSAIRDGDNKIVQISAPISPGNSGSPIMDMSGNVFAIATYQHKEGQNLNFGYWIGCKEKLITNSSLKLSNQTTSNLYVLNQICKTESGLILNSIELNEKNTILNMTFTNASLAYGDDAFIFASFGDNEKSFYIQDNTTKENFYIYDATIGNSAKNPTQLKLGEAKRFKLFFPRIGNPTEISIFEGSESSSWKFVGLILSNFKSFSFTDKQFFNNFYYQTGLAYLSEKEYAEAYVILKDFSTKNSDNDFAYNLAGIISYILGNNLDAYLNIKNAIALNPTNDNYYFNLYYLNNANNDKDDALKSISSAIQLNNDQPEYYVYRAQLYMEKEYWKEAVSDFNHYISSDRSIPAVTYFQRGVAKMWLDDKSGCGDFEKAFQSAESEDEKKSISKWYNEYCR